MSNVRLPLLPPSEPPPSSPLPDAERVPLMQIGDLARETGKSIRAIHLYEQLNLLHPAARSKGGFRLYGTEALTRIRWIGKLQDLGLSLTEIQAIVREWEELGSAPRAMVKMRDTYTAKLRETQETIARLRDLERELEASLTYLDTCDVCDPARLIEACEQCELHDCQTHVPELVAGFRAN